MHFEPGDFVSFTITMLENYGIYVTVNATVVFWMVSLDITGFDGLYIYGYVGGVFFDWTDFLAYK